MMDLINTLNEELEQRARASEQLQQQITRNQASLQRQYKVLRTISITAVIGIIAVGYFAAKPDSAIDERIDNISMDTVRMSSQIKTINNNMQAINNEINKVNNGLNAMSANFSTTNQNIGKLTSDVDKLNADAANRTKETPYRGYPADPRSYWR
jgi:peptidoglycan hydrolase CwlO-like protein